MGDLSALLSPRSIAVIGASPDITILRGRTLKVMLGHPYRGKIYPISRSHAQVQGLKAYPSVDELPERVDLALLIIPAEHVLEELERCGKAGIKAALIITSGFAEQKGDAGAELQRQLRALGALYQMIVCGPNTEGFANTAASLCATFSPVVDAQAVSLIPAARTDGHVAVIAQSGGVGFAFFDRGRPKEIPYSYIVTTGNEACLEVFDVVEYLLEEGRTEVFLLFLENVKDANTFRRVAAKALAAGKPIIVTKIGRSDAGQRAAASHTAALAGSYETYRAMFRHFGIIEGADIEEMVDLANAFSLCRGRLPASKRVGIGTPSGGAGGWMADACSAQGMDIPELDASTRAQIDRHIPAYGTSQNPVDCTAQAIRELGYTAVMTMVAASPSVDSVVMIVSTRNPELFEREQEKLHLARSQSGKSLVMWSYTQPHPTVIKILSEVGIPLFTNMQHCARALAVMAAYRLRREQWLSGKAEKPSDPARIARVRLALVRKILCEYEVAPLLEEYGIARLPAQLAQSAEQAIAIAKSIGAPVALKIQSPNILHKTDMGGVALNLRSTDEIRIQFDQLIERARKHASHESIRGVLVQRMSEPGVEVIIGIRRDPMFGPMLMVGIGGIHVEVLRDIAFAPVPINDVDGRDLIAGLKARRLFDGVRGAKPADLPSLIQLIVRISQFAAEHADDLEELELNPVIVHEVGKGVSVVDALIIAGRMNQVLASDRVPQISR